MARFDPMQPPPPDPEPSIPVFHFPSPRWRGIVPDHLTFSEWEWGWFQQIQPTKPRLFIDGNRAKARGHPYVRFAETMPDGKSARPTLERYLEAMRGYVLFRQGLGPEPEKRGPPIGLKHPENCCDLHPSNRVARPVAAPVGAPNQNRRRGHDAAWSVRIRVDAIFDGKDPERAWAAETKRQALKAAEREAKRQGKSVGDGDGGGAAP